MHILLDAISGTSNDLSVVHPLLPYFSSFGLGVVVMAIFLLYMGKLYKYERTTNRQLTKDFISLAQETLVTLKDLAHIIDSLGPNIQSMTVETKTQIINEITSLKTHLNLQTETLKHAINEIKPYLINNKRKKPGINERNQGT